MRGWLLVLPIMALASPALAQSIALDPFKTSLGFAPQAPRSVDARHPLFGRVLVEEVEAMPRGVGAFLIPVTGPREFNRSLRSALASANFLAATPDQARVRLRVTWRNFSLPFRIGLSSRATTVVRYDLVRIDTGQVIFSREIETNAEFRGGDASTRARGTGRAAVLANIASLSHCLERAPFEPMGGNCVLQPTGSFSAPITTYTYIYR